MRRRASFLVVLLAASFLLMGQVSIRPSQVWAWASSSAARLSAAGNTYDVTLADWGTTISAENRTLANGEIVFLGAALVGRFTVVNVNNGGYGDFAMRGTVNATVEMADSLTAFSITKDTATSINVYYDAAGSSGAGYYLQNNIGSSRTVRVLLIGA
jgi:hypothetical protein